MKKWLKVITLQDPDDERIKEIYLVKTHLSEKELQETVRYIVYYFENSEDVVSWNYEILMKELEKRGFIEIIPAEKITLYA